MKLAIAASSFNEPSETFIRAYVDNTFPSHTVLLCDDGASTEKYNHPVLSELDPYPAPVSFSERIWNSFRHRWSNQVDRRITGVSERRIRSFLIRNKVTHCLAEFGPMGCRVSRATERAGVRLFAHFHGYDATALPQSWVWRRHYRRLFDSAYGVIVPSNFIANRIADLGCPAEKIHVSNNGVDINRFNLSSHTSRQVLAVGRFVEKKAPLSSIRAFAEAARNYPDAHLHMVGDGPLLESARRYIEAESLQDSVTLYGSQTHEAGRELFEKAAIFIQHSITASDNDMEGFPVAILEAMAVGIPVVSTHHSGIPEMVQDGLSGFLVDEGDETGMARSIETLLSDSENSRRMGSVGRVRVREEFTNEVVATRLRAIMGLEL